MQQSGMEIIEKSEQPKYIFTCGISVLSLFIFALIVLASSNAKLISVRASEAALLAGVIVAIAICILSITGWVRARGLDRLRSSGFSILALSGSFWRGYRAVLPIEVEELYRIAIWNKKNGHPVRIAVLQSPRTIWYVCHVTPKGKHSDICHIYIDKCPTHWPCTSIEFFGYFEAEWATREFRPVSLEDPEFDQDFLVRSTDTHFAKLLIGPDLKRLVMSPYVSEIVIGGGAICVITRESLSQEQIDSCILTLAEVRKAIPAELADWTPQSREPSSSS